ncbi:MAG: hypothetical protein JXA20_13345 [Spirochaetes bacterium]|nr:hypothetical protein [Spirochaetota bacterium]
MRKHEKLPLPDIVRDTTLFHLHWHHVIFDVFLVVWSEFFLYSIITRGKNLYQFLGTDHLAVSTVAITFVLSWYLSIVYFHVDRKIANATIRTILFLLVLAIPFFMCFFGYLSIKGIIGREPDNTVFFWTFFGTLFGIFAGFAFGYTEQGADEGKSIMHPRILSLLFITIIATFYISFFLMGQVNPFIVIASGGLVSLILFGIHKYLDKREPKDLSRAYHYFRRFIFPFLLFLILCFWEELYLWGKIHLVQQKNETPSFLSMVGYLSISGVIPVRIIMILYPRVSITGICTGIVSLGYFLYSLRSLIAGLFP